jgi:uncharacterized protein with GYD domain
MATYLFCGSYTQSGLPGLLKEGGANRRAAVQQLIAGLGGSLECFYYAFGQHDFYIIADLPSNVEAATASLMVHATGAVQGEMTALLTPEEIDAASQKTVNYHPPGQ